ncbi:hypothetical protein [Nostoc sp. 'Peltigera malacea cyanobiont' DB3992]|nr:hypothetical protein [Nostoc sp. 'Peltigera malacea cyanobiont' DB3992]
MPATGYAYASVEYILTRWRRQLKNLLQSLGKLNRPYLTVVEENCESSGV